MIICGNPFAVGLLITAWKISKECAETLVLCSMHLDLLCCHHTGFGKLTVREVL